MNNKDRKRFTEKLSAVYSVYRKELTRPQAEVWWNALTAFDCENVGMALDYWVKTERFPPTPADIIGIFPDHLNHPEPETAWAGYPKKEQDSGWVTDEMMLAGSAAQDAMDRGDMISARMAFLEAYKKLIADARKLNKPAKYFYSAPTGMNSYEELLERREHDTIKARRLQWITNQRAANALTNIYDQLGLSSTQQCHRLQSSQIDPPPGLLAESTSKSEQDNSETISASVSGLISRGQQ